MDNQSDTFISLKEASALCEYSQDYLNLLVRKGYLKAIKIGRNWVTTKEWLNDYLQRIETKREHSRARKITAYQKQPEKIFTNSSILESQQSHKLHFSIIKMFVAATVVLFIISYTGAAYFCDFLWGHKFITHDIVPASANLMAAAESLFKETYLSLGAKVDNSQNSTAYSNSKNF